MKYLLLSISLFVSIACASLDDGLVFHYPLNGNAQDISLNGNDGTFFGTILSVDNKQGEINQAAHFNGKGLYNNSQGGYIFVNNDNPPKNILNDDAFSVSFWVSFNELSNQSQYYLFTTGTFSILKSDTYNTLQIFGQKTVEPLSNFSYTSTVDYTVNQWYHIALVKSGSSLRLYVNGELDLDITDFSMIPHGTNWRIGRTPSPTKYYIPNAALDEFRLYDRELTANEIAQLYTGIEQCGVTLLYDDFNREEGSQIDWAEDGIWRGRYELPYVSATTEDGQCVVHGWSWVKSLESFEIFDDSWLVCEATLKGKSEMWVHRYNHEGYGCLFTYNGADSIQARSNNLGYWPQNWYNNETVVSQNSEITVKIMVKGKHTVFFVTDDNGTRKIADWSNNTRLTNQPMVLRLGYFGVYDNASVRRVSESDIECEGYVHNAIPTIDLSSGLTVYRVDLPTTTITAIAHDEDENTEFTYRWLHGNTVIQDWMPANENNECILSLENVNLPEESYIIRVEVNDGITTNTQEMYLHIIGKPMQEISVSLLDSKDNGIAGGIVSYKLDEWIEAGNTDEAGILRVEVPEMLDYLDVKVTYDGQTAVKNQAIYENPDFLFKTINVQTTLTNNEGISLPNGSVTHTIESVNSFGITDSSGTCERELLPGVYTFAMTYEGQQQEKNQDIESNPVVDFNTIKTTIQLQNSKGGPLAKGIAAHQAIGDPIIIGATNDSGEVTKELLPGVYTFSMLFKEQTALLEQDITHSPTVTFSTVNVTAILTDIYDNPLKGGIIHSRITDWEKFGKTNNQGLTKKELMPGMYQFRAIYNGDTLNLSQDVGQNPTVEFVCDTSQNGGNDDHTVLLLHFDEPTPPFLDFSKSKHSTKNCQNVSPATGKFGGAASFRGKESTLIIPKSKDFHLGNTWTIDFWLKPNLLYMPRQIICGQFKTNYSWHIEIFKPKQIRFVRRSYANHVVCSTSELPMGYSGWYHIAIVQRGTHMWIYFNGKEVANGPIYGGLMDYKETFEIGPAGPYGTGGFNGADFYGKLDEFRISKGIARWTEEFIPNDRPYK